MGLNVKAAMMICGACIGAMSWLLQQAGLPQVELPSPLLAGMVSADHVPPLPTSGPRRSRTLRVGPAGHASSSVPT